MKSASKDSSVFSRVMAFLKGRPLPSRSSTAKKSSARVLDKQHRQSRPVAALPFRAAEIVCDSTGCDAAKALAGLRFLANEVPRLPLPQCTAPKCRCTYARHNDRRNLSDERRAQFSLRTKLYATATDAEERRRKYGRREGEFAGSEERYDFKKWDG